VLTSAPFTPHTGKGPKEDPNKPDTHPEEWMTSFELADYLEANVKTVKFSQVCDASTD
jgi:hypothetical protein